MAQEKDKWYPTAQLRWKRREHPHGGYDMFLEQLWEYNCSIEGETDTDWRKVEEVR